MGKPTICIGENKGADQLCSNWEADQHLCFYAPNFEEVDGAYWFGSVRPVVCSQSTLSTLELGS